MSKEVVTTKIKEQKREFHIKILGRLLEHLGVQMYKHRDAAIAELVANCWDAGAKNVWIYIPNENDYDPLSSEVIIEDEKDLQDKYLVIGRNRRTAEDSEEYDGRKVMGRKGIGKLAGFGIATNMAIETWVGNHSIELNLNLNQLKNNPITETKEDVEKILEGIIRNIKPAGVHLSSETGTRIKLFSLKQKSALLAESLHISLSRRFSRTVRGHMKIFINDESLRPIEMELHKNSPPLGEKLKKVTLEDGNGIKYSYAFSNTPIRESSLKGWTILVNGKTAQAPPFFFNVDSVGKSQHSSKYLIGTIEADFLDKGKDDEGDTVSTDRQEIDWEREETRALWDWGFKHTQEFFNEIAERNADFSINIIMEDEGFLERIEALDSPLKNQCIKFIGSIGKINVVEDEMSVKDKIFQMADQIVKAFEYRHFIDVIDDIEKASENPDNLEMLLSHLAKWEILESRSILEIMKGRLQVIDKFYEMIVNRAPETANREIGADNFHDLISGFPWLLNPEWQVYLEEKSISKILREKGVTDYPLLMKNKRVDFLALQGDNEIAVIEIKSVDEILTLEELRRLEDYKNSLAPAHKQRLIAVLIFGGKHRIDNSSWNRYKKSKDFLILEWKNIFIKNKNYYEHYRAVLENHIKNPTFKLKEEEIINVKKMVKINSVYRDQETRKKGLGPQDINNKVE